MLSLLHRRKEDSHRLPGCLLHVSWDCGAIENFLRGASEGLCRVPFENALLGESATHASPDAGNCKHMGISQKHGSLFLAVARLALIDLHFYCIRHTTP